MSAPHYFPGRDYPDREVWLAKRATPRKNRRYVYIYMHPPYTQDGPDGALKRPEMKPFAFGINAHKRRMDAAARSSGLSRRAGRQPIVASRKQYRERTLNLWRPES